MDWDSSLSLSTYKTAGFTDGELEAIHEYRERRTLRAYFDLEELLEETGDDLATALHSRAGELTRWYEDLTALMADPRLENARRRETNGPRYDERGKGPYCGAVARWLGFAAEDYHRHRQGFEHAVTVWALNEQVSGTYPPNSRSVDHINRTLKLWD